MTYDEINEKVREIADAFRTWGAFIGCSMFYTIAMLIHSVLGAWPDAAAVALAAAPWTIVVALQCFFFEEVRRRTVARLHATLRAWYLRGPGARGATVIAAEPLCITYDDFGRRNLAAITFVWSRAEFCSRSTNLLEPGV